MFDRSKNSIPLDLTHITLFIALFIVALMGIRTFDEKRTLNEILRWIKISKYKPLGANSIEVAKLQQKRLYPFIIYTYSIEIITLPTFIHACARTICIFAGCKYDVGGTNSILFLAIYFLLRCEHSSLF
ncbi:hypothetical protein X798_06695 [Onchocerca flexuosa]|uniref:Uncharacterized protein n=1 Tax=Onchocerca flexuosa TaxID=387005 RepID=A0A238BN64_9BILA|nr:hypothetical protein X798_06695 [Onchocerca flexuosa]